MSPSIDDWAADRLSVMAWLGVGVLAVTLVAAVGKLSQWAVAGFTGDSFGVGVGLVIFAAFVAMGVYESGTPDIEATCEQCGAYIRVDDAEDPVSECVEVHAAGAPKRAAVGPLTAVTRTQRRSWMYCSPACARADTRVLIGPHDHETLETNTPEVSES